MGQISTSNLNKDREKAENRVSRESNRGSAATTRSYLAETQPTIRRHISMDTNLSQCTPMLTFYSAVPLGVWPIGTNILVNHIILILSKPILALSY